MNWFKKLRTTLFGSRETLAELEALALAKRPVDVALWDDLEELLIRADFGAPTTTKIVAALRVVAQQDRYQTSDQVVARLQRDVRAFLTLPEPGLSLGSVPAIVLVVGVNGSGKTTTIGKLAALLRGEGRRVLVVAADTFRAAAGDQLAVWAQRAGVEIVQGADGADPAAVVFDGVRAARVRGVDVAIIDTAGRLQTKVNLMEELKKMRRVIERETGRPPDETLLVVDGTTGQNALSQARLFNEATTLTGLVVTKLDSTAKGGVVVALVDQLGKPVKFVGTGEQIAALEPFDPGAFVDALFTAPPAIPAR